MASRLSECELSFASVVGAGKKATSTKNFSSEKEELPICGHYIRKPRFHDETLIGDYWGSMYGLM